MAISAGQFRGKFITAVADDDILAGQFVQFTSTAKENLHVGLPTDITIPLAGIATDDALEGDLVNVCVEGIGRCLVDDTVEAAGVNIMSTTGVGQNNIVGIGTTSPHYCGGTSLEPAADSGDEIMVVIRQSYLPAQ